MYSIWNDETLDWLILFIFFIIWSYGVFLVIRGTIKKSRWGIPIFPRYCSECGAKFPFFIKSESLKQSLYGWRNCQSCGAECDQWGNLTKN